MKKAIGGLLALILVLGLCAGCGNSDQTLDQSGEPNQTQTPAGDAGNIYTQLLDVDPSETVLETDGNQIPMELYLYWLTYSCSSMEYNLNMAYYSANMYGDTANAEIYSQLLNEDGTVKWDGELEGMSLSEMARRQAEDNVLAYAVIENVAAKHNISLTDEDNARLAEDKAAYIEQLGGQEAYEQDLREMGISEATFDRVSISGCLYQHLLELAQDPASDFYTAPTDNDSYVDHILLITTDSETGEALSEEEIQSRRAQAEDLLAQLQAADAGELETLFTQLAEEYGEDPGRAAEAGYLVRGDGTYVPEFEETALALEIGEVSGIVETSYGYHILLRKELTEAQLAAVAEENMSSYMDSQLEAARDNLVRSDKLDGINVGEFFAKYKEAVEAMYPQEDAGDTAGMDDSTAG